MDILFENAMAPFSVDTDDLLLMGTSGLDDNPCNRDPDYTYIPGTYVEISAAVQTFEPHTTAQQLSIPRHANIVSCVRKSSEPSPECERSMFADAPTHARNSGSVPTHYLSSDGELVASEGCYDGDCLGFHPAQSPQGAAAETRARSRHAPAASPSTGAAGAPEASRPCDGGPLHTLGGDDHRPEVPDDTSGDGGYAEAQPRLRVLGPWGTSAPTGDRRTSTHEISRAGHSRMPAHGRGAPFTLETVRALEARMPLPAAATALGVSQAELRRACRRLGVTRWSHRAHAATAAAAAAPGARTVAYAVNLRRRYGGAPPS